MMETANFISAFVLPIFVGLCAKSGREVMFFIFGLTIEMLIMVTK